MVFSGDVSDGARDWYRLGTVSVPPEYQRHGIGGALIREGQSQLETLGARGCCLVGHPELREFRIQNPRGQVHEGVPTVRRPRLPARSCGTPGRLPAQPRLAARRPPSQPRSHAPRGRPRPDGPRTNPGRGGHPHPRRRSPAGPGCRDRSAGCSTRREPGTSASTQAPGGHGTCQQGRSDP